MSDTHVHGAFASVTIRYEGSLRSLADRLSKILILHNLTVQPDEYPPYDDIASAETLAWELWLNPSSIETGVYDLLLETTDCILETHHNRLHDLSPWLARFLSKMLKVEVRPAPRLTTPKTS
jgi:hypothetical protein